MAMPPDIAAVEWSAAQAAELERALESRPDALGYPELAGFLFALACSPELIRPSQWLPQVLGEADLGSDEQANRLLSLVTDLHNHINLQVLAGTPALPACIDPLPDPLANFAPQGRLGRWAGGFGAGQMWTEDSWTAALARSPTEQAAALDQGLGALNVELAFFMGRELAQRALTEMPGRPSLEEAARRALAQLDDGMAALARLGRGLGPQPRRRRQPRDGRKGKRGRS